MPYCPECKSDYNPGFKQCADCDVPLTEGVQEAPVDKSFPSRELQTVATFDNPVKAQIAVGLLEAEGINAFLNDAEMINMDPLLLTAVGGVKVHVESSDAGRAFEILKHCHDDAEVKTAPPPNGSTEDIPACPSCGSRKTFREAFSAKAAFLSILLLGFPLFSRSWRWKCSKCCKRFDFGLQKSPS